MKIERSTFSQSTVELDGNVYINCTFHEAKMVYAGGPLPQFTGCHFEGCHWEFADAAQRTLLFLTAMYNGGGKQLVEEIFDSIRLGC